MSSVQSGSSKQPLRRFVSAAPFPRDIFSYTVVSEPYPHEVLIPVPGANSRNCPAGRVLRESGKKLYPGVNKAIKTYMVGVIDTQSGISGFIDPNSPLFALYSTDLPAVFKDGRDPGPQGKVDVGPPLYTNGNLYVAGNGVVDGTLRTNILYANDAIIDTGSFSTMTGAELDVDQATVSSLLGGNLIVSSTESQTVLASTIQSGHVDGITGRFEQLEISTFSAGYGVVTSVLYVGNLSTANTSANTITTRHMDASTIEVSTLAVNQELGASTMYSINLRAVNGEIINLETSTIIVSTLCAKDELIGSTVYGVNLRALNGEIRHLDASTIQVSTLHASQDIDASTIVAVNMSSLNGLFVNISGFDVRTSTIGAVAISTSSLGVTQELDASTITSLNISSINGLFDNLRASTIIAENIEFSTINGNSIEVGEINVSTLTTSSISSAGTIISNRQIRPVGPSGQRVPLDGSDPLIDLDIELGPFLYIDGNGNNTVTCSNFRFCDLLYLQTSGTGNLTFSTGFGVSSITMAKEQGIIHFICDGYHMIELSRSKWAHTF